jgi:hypothetical protein
MNYTSSKDSKSTVDERDNLNFLRYPWGWEWVVQDDVYGSIRVTKLMSGMCVTRHADDPLGHEIWVRKGFLRVRVPGDADGMDRVVMPGSSIDLFGLGPVKLIGGGDVEWVETTGWVDASFCAWDIAVPLPVPSP